MGALTPVISGLSTLTGLVNTVDGLVSGVRALGGDPYEEQSRRLRAQQDLALKQLRQQQDAGYKDLEERTALERERMAADAAASEESRRAALRRAVARQRAAFGAQGLDAGDGSAEAVLLGLFEESDQDRESRERLDSLRSAALEQDLAARQRINVLQQAQLKERQRLERMAEGF